MVTVDSDGADIDISIASPEPPGQVALLVAGQGEPVHALGPGGVMFEPGQSARQGPMVLPVDGQLGDLSGSTSSGPPGDWGPGGMMFFVVVDLDFSLVAVVVQASVCLVVCARPLFLHALANGNHLMASISGGVDNLT